MRDAYRQELRHRLNAVNLDDLHDHDSNSLFELQFKAAMPGQYKDKVSVARPFFRPFLPTKKSSRSISPGTHLANRLNSPFPEERRQCPDLKLALKLQNSGLVEFVKIDVRPEFAEPDPKDGHASFTCPCHRG